MRMALGPAAKVVLLSLAGWSIFDLGAAAPAGTVVAWQRPWERVDVASSQKIEVGGSILQVDFARGSFDLGEKAILSHVQTAAAAVTAYYGHFPVAKARVLIVPVDGERGVLQGTTWGNMHGWPGFTRMGIGQHTTQAELDDDWMMTHELVHMAFPSLPDDQHWMEEGLATYVEPIARVQAGELTAAKIWHDMLRDMAKGEPQAGDQGLDQTHTWGRTYWGGAMFCLVADVSIRRETKNKKGLQDALRAVVAAGLAIDQDRDIAEALTVGDKATGTQVLMQLYASWKDNPVQADLDQLWRDLGVTLDGDSVRFDDMAPLAEVRKGITEKRR